MGCCRSKETPLAQRESMREQMAQAAMNRQEAQDRRGLQGKGSMADKRKKQEESEQRQVAQGSGGASLTVLIFFEKRTVDSLIK